MRRKIFPDHNTFRESPLEGTQNLNVTNRKSQNVLHWMDRLHKACYKISPRQDLSLLTKRFKNVCIFENRRRNKNTQVEQELLTLPEHLSSTPFQWVCATDLQFSVQCCVHHCLYFSPFFFLVIVLYVLRFMTSDYPFGQIFF